MARGGVLAQSAPRSPARALAPRPGERAARSVCRAQRQEHRLAALMENGGEVLAVERDPRAPPSSGRPFGVCLQPACESLLADAAHSHWRKGAVGSCVRRPPCSGLGTLQARADLAGGYPSVRCPSWRGSRPRSSPPAPQGPSGWRAGLLYVHHLSARERASDLRLHGINTDFSLDDLGGSSRRSVRPDRHAGMDGRAC